MSLSVSNTSQPLPGSLTLSEAWAQAQRDIRHTQSPPPATTPDTLVTLHTTALHSLLTLRRLIHTAGVLSANDRLAELPTSSLRYVLVPSLLAGVLLSWPGLDGRRGRLEQCMNLWQQLLTTVDAMDGLTEAEEKRWRRVRAAVVADGGDDDAGERHGATSAAMDAGQQRQDKIARFKQQREWQQQIEAYEAKQQRRQNTTAGSTAINVAADTTGDEGGDDDDVDEEAARQYWQLRLRVAVNSAMDELLTGQQELQFLKEREAREANPQLREEREREEDDRRRASDGHQPLTYTISSSGQLRNQPIPSHMQSYLHAIPQLPQSVGGSNGVGNGVVAGGGVVTTLDGLMGRGRREDVFRVVNGPTMSVEQWAEQEMREGRLPTPQQPPAPTRQQRGYVGSGDSEHDARAADGDDGEGVGESGGESDERRMDGKRVEERDWDNWKDDHERGAGNRKR